jgi:hypothetical protein
MTDSPSNTKKHSEDDIFRYSGEWGCAGSLKHVILSELHAQALTVCQALQHIWPSDSLSIDLFVSYYPHFTEEENEVQKSTLCSRSQS